MVASTSVPGSAPSELIPKLKEMVATCVANWVVLLAEGLKHSLNKLTTSAISSSEAKAFSAWVVTWHNDSVTYD
jgi:hypothetical protein